MCFRPEIRICSISAYATLGSRLNLSALSVLLKELYKVDNSFDNTRFRKKHGSIEALTSSRTFFNSLAFPLRFRTNGKTYNLHFRIFTTGTIHIAGASDNDTVRKGFQLVCGLVACWNEYEKEIPIVSDAASFGLKNIRIAMLHTIYYHHKPLDRENVALNLQKQGRNVRYDPSLHNAINVRFTSNDGAFLIFKSGKILITGCKEIDTCKRELETIMPFLR